MNATAELEAAAQSSWIHRLGSIGYLTRGVLFLVLGALVVLTGLGLKRSENDPVGALQALAREPFGGPLVLVVGVGIAAYAAWNVVHGLARALARPRSKKRALVGAGYVLTGVFYAPLAWAALKIFAGRGDEPGDRHAGGLLAEPHGQWLLGVVGLVLIGVALVQLVVGVLATFRRELALERAAAPMRVAIIGLGAVGFAARAILFGLVGGFLAHAAWHVNPSEAHGPDEALDVVLRLPHGALLLAPLGIGFMAFGVFSVLAAGYLRE